MGEYPYCELSDGEVIKGVCYKFQRLLQPVECTEKLLVDQFQQQYYYIIIINII